MLKGWSVTYAIQKYISKWLVYWFEKMIWAENKIEGSFFNASIDVNFSILTKVMFLQVHVIEALQWR